MIYRIPVSSSLFSSFFPAPLFANSPAWEATQDLRGQMVYTTSRRSVVGDVILRTAANGIMTGFFPKEAFPSYSCKAMAMNCCTASSLDRMEGPVDRAIGLSIAGRFLNRFILIFTPTKPVRVTAGMECYITRNNGKLMGAKIDFARHESMIFSFCAMSGLHDTAPNQLLNSKRRLGPNRSAKRWYAPFSFEIGNWIARYVRARSAAGSPFHGAFGLSVFVATAGSFS